MHGAELEPEFAQDPTNDRGVDRASVATVTTMGVVTPRIGTIAELPWGQS
jgi:hypothetical protein